MHSLDYPNYMFSNQFNVMDNGTLHRYFQPAINTVPWPPAEERRLQKALLRFHASVGAATGPECIKKAFRDFVKSVATREPEAPIGDDHQYFAKLCMGGGQDVNDCGRWFYIVSLATMSNSILILYRFSAKSQITKDGARFPSGYPNVSLRRPCRIVASSKSMQTEHGRSARIGAPTSTVHPIEPHVPIKVVIRARCPASPFPSLHPQSSIEDRALHSTALLGESPGKGLDFHLPRRTKSLT